VIARITVSGDIGSGKSAISRAVAEHFGIKRFSTGDFQRELAARLGMSTLELNKFSEDHPEIDSEIDGLTKAVAVTNEAFVMDSRIAWIFVPDALRVWLKVDPHIAVARIRADRSRAGEAYIDDARAIVDIGGRRESERKRFESMYGVDFTDLRHYDLIIDTSLVSPDAIVGLIGRAMQGETLASKYWVSPRQLLPTQHVRQLQTDPTEFGSRVESDPISVAVSNELLFIVDGHNRASAAIFANVKLVPIAVVANGEEEVVAGLTADLYARTEFQKSTAYDWEDIHGFRFARLPGD
jgi:cytidylate kinase